MKDRRLPPHWSVVGNGVAAVRSDGIEIARERHASRFVVLDKLGFPLTQQIKHGPNKRSRLFKYLDHAAKAADAAWPLTSPRQKNIDLIQALYGMDTTPGRQMLFETLIELGFNALTDSAIDRLAAKQQAYEQKVR